MHPNDALHRDEPGPPIVDTLTMAGEIGAELLGELLCAALEVAVGALSAL